jgi:serine/threonine protein kinase
MAEVYRATDTNLKRAVGIKVLPDAVSADPERLARFQREAEVLGSLNHPNIAVIHGLERSGATSALGMELAEGSTLADRIAQGPMPVDEALAIARQIAEGLEAAHERGVIHRDLKPANIKVRPDGGQDSGFRLAKALGAESVAPSSIASANSPTLTSPVGMTGVGVIIRYSCVHVARAGEGRWSPDGRFLIFEEGEGPGATVGGRRDLWLLPIRETASGVEADAPRPLLVTRFNKRGAVFAPDGHYIAFVSDESGRPEVYVQPFPGPGPKIPVSTNSGLQPCGLARVTSCFVERGTGS